MSKFLELKDTQNTVIDISIIKVINFREMRFPDPVYRIYIFTTLYDHNYLEINYDTNEFIAKRDYEKLKRLLVKLINNEEESV